MTSGLPVPYKAPVLREVKCDRTHTLRDGQPAREEDGG